MTNDPAIAKKINSAVFPGSQGGPLMHVIAGKAVAFGEALEPEFAAYQARLHENCAILAAELMSRGLNLVSGGTDNHLVLLDLRGTGTSGRELEVRLDEVHITTNKNKIPGDPLSAKETSGLRLGTAAVTARGFIGEDIVEIADLINLAVRDFDAHKEEIAGRVAALCKKYPLYE